MSKRTSTARFPLIAAAVLAALAVSLVRCGGGGGSSSTSPGSGTVTTTHALVAWNDLGMHCMDNDYSVFAILPPYNNLHAQLVNRVTGGLVSSGVTVTYEATADTRGSIDSFADGKTNFWRWMRSFFGAGADNTAGMGLAGNRAPDATPRPLAYDPAARFWKAEGIPIVPVDDAGHVNTYPMVRLVARDLQGNLLAETKTVLPVSTEMTCKGCHASGSGAAARPAGGWVSDAVPERDWRLNILRLHDERNATGLEASARGGHPVLCAACHRSNALGTAGSAGVPALTAAVHSRHAAVILPGTATPLDQGGRTACYACHPGSVTQCLRGVMGNARDGGGNLLLQCQSCHGTLSAVGASTRAGWVDLPGCGNCHYLSAGVYVRSDNVFSSRWVYRSTTGVFGSASLYKLSAGHGNVQCEACHGSTHAEYPSSEANDNFQSAMLQGYAGKIGECGVCHQAVPLTKSAGPHGLHTIGQAWVGGHESFARADVAYCATCHGADYRGTFLSAAFTGRTFAVGEGGGTRSFAKGWKFGCYDCHDGPGGG